MDGLGSLDGDGSAALSYELSSDPNGANDLIVVNGTLMVDQLTGDPNDNFTLNVALTDPSIASSTYTLIDATTLTGTATGSAFNVNVVDSQGNSVGATRQSFAVDVDAAADELQLEVSGAAANLTWNGTLSSDWDAPDPNGVGGTANWTGGGGDNRFFNLDSVTFPDGALQTTVNVAQSVIPGSMTFTNSSRYLHDHRCEWHQRWRHAYAKR